MMYEIRDPIHENIPFSEAERRVIDHPFFQRLRFIRQLGLKSLVYPGAVHDRFMHSLGAMHLAGRVFDALDAASDVFHRLEPATRKYIRQTLRYAALLHDVGHGPFSHASEHLMPKLGALKIPAGWYTAWNPKRRASHEDYSVLLIATLGSAREKIFSKSEAQDIASLVHKTVRPSANWSKHFKNERESKGYHAFLKRLISGELDVDRMDYLLRDSYFTGVPYGQYDLPWLLQTMGAVQTASGPVLVIKEGGLRAFEDFLLARYHMFLQVYFHRTTSIFEYYVERAIIEKEIKMSIPADAYAYTELHDGSVTEAIFEAAKNSKHRFSRMLVDRSPMKQLYRFEQRDAKSRLRYRRMISILKKEHISYTELAAQKSLFEHPVARVGDARILVSRRVFDNVEYVPVEQVSTLFKKYNEQIDQVYIYVFREDYTRALAALRKIR